MTYGNLPPTTNIDASSEYFSTFFNSIASYSQNTNDAIIAYFQTITGSAENGTILAGSVLYTASQQGLNPMTLIDEFKKMKPGELNAYLTMFLNLNRVGTSLLGLSNQPQVSPYITRAIRP